MANSLIASSISSGGSIRVLAAGDSSGEFSIDVSNPTIGILMTIRGYGYSAKRDTLPMTWVVGYDQTLELKPIGWTLYMETQNPTWYWEEYQSMGTLMLTSTQFSYTKNSTYGNYYSKAKYLVLG